MEPYAKSMQDLENKASTTEMRYEMLKSEFDSSQK